MWVAVRRIQDNQSTQQRSPTEHMISVSLYKLHLPHCVRYLRRGKAGQHYSYDSVTHVSLPVTRSSVGSSSEDKQRIGQKSTTQAGVSDVETLGDLHIHHDRQQGTHTSSLDNPTQLHGLGSHAYS